MHHKKSLLLILLAVVVLVLVVFWISLRNTQLTNIQNSVHIGQATEAPKGQLVSGFPQNLKLVSDASVTDSFAIPYQNFNQYSAVFKSSATISVVYSQYLNYLSTNGYTILNKGEDKKSAHIYGTKTGSDVNVTISSVNGETQINVVYLNKSTQ